MEDTIQKFNNAVENIKKDVDDTFQGSVLHCHTCGFQYSLRPGEASHFVFNGWPKCCGKTMRPKAPKSV